MWDRQYKISFSSVWRDKCLTLTGAEVTVPMHCCQGASLSPQCHCQTCVTDPKGNQRGTNTVQCFSPEHRGETWKRTGWLSRHEGLRLCWLQQAAAIFAPLNRAMEGIGALIDVWAMQGALAWESDCLLPLLNITASDTAQPTCSLNSEGLGHGNNGFATWSSSYW